MASFLRQPNLFVVLWGAVITVLSLLPGKTLPAMDIWDWVGTDKLAHAIVYGCWSYLWIRRVYLQQASKPAQRVIFGLVIMCMYGAVLEVLQSAIHPDRYFEVPDIVANIIGAFASYGIFIILKKTS